jgi:hypothetical protein
MDNGSPISYAVLESGTDVICSEGELVGKVEHVLADAEEDVFDGLVIDCHRGPGGLRFVDADQVAGIYERAVVLTIAGTAIEQLPKPAPAPAAMESHGEPESPLQTKLHRAWNLLSGDY